MKNKKQHYIPQCYLKGFINEQYNPFGNEEIVYFDKFNNKIDKKGISNFCQKAHYYSQFDFDNTKQPILEKEISKIESSYNNIVKKIESNIKQIDYTNSIIPLTNLEKNNLIKFIIWQLKRVPKFIDELETKIKKSLDEDIFRAYKIDNEQRKRIVQNTKLEIIKSIGDSETNLVFQSLIKRNFYFLYIEMNDSCFISTDNPINIHNYKQSNGIIYPDTEIYMPINSKVMLLLYEFGNSEYYVPFNNRTHIRKTNINLFRNSYNYSYCKSETYLKRICKK